MAKIPVNAQIFFDNDNEGAEFSTVSQIRVFGSSVAAATNLSELKKC